MLFYGQTTLRGEQITVGTERSSSGGVQVVAAWKAGPPHGGPTIFSKFGEGRGRHWTDLTYTAVVVYWM